jgi:membrane protein required for colicin V production
MNYLDIIIAIILILFAIGGLRNGIIKEAFSLVAFIGGIYGAFKLSTYVGELLAKLINVSPEWMVVISFIVVFIALALLISWLGNLLSDLFASLSLGFVDKLGGLVFGIAKGFLLIGVLILILDFFGIKDVLKEETREGSKLYKTSEQVATWIYDNKDGWLKKLNKEFDEIDKTNDNDDVLDII